VHIYIYMYIYIYIYIYSIYIGKLSEGMNEEKGKRERRWQAGRQRREAKVRGDGSKGEGVREKEVEGRWYLHHVEVVGGFLVELRVDQGTSCRWRERGRGGGASDYSMSVDPITLTHRWDGRGPVEPDARARRLHTKGTLVRVDAREVELQGRRVGAAGEAGVVLARLVHARLVRHLHASWVRHARARAVTCSDSQSRPAAQPAAPVAGSLRAYFRAGGGGGACTNLLLLGALEHAVALSLALRLGLCQIVGELPVARRVDLRVDERAGLVGVDVVELAAPLHIGDLRRAQELRLACRLRTGGEGERVRRGSLARRGPCGGHAQAAAARDTGRGSAGGPHLQAARGKRPDTRRPAAAPPLPRPPRSRRA